MSLSGKTHSLFVKAAAKTIIPFRNLTNLCNKHVILRPVRVIKVAELLSQKQSLTSFICNV